MELKLDQDPLLISQNGDRLGRRLVTSAALLWGGNQILRVMQLATMAILARILVPSDYGVVALASIVTGLLEVTTNMQLNGSIVRTQSLERSHLDSAFTMQLIRGTLVATALVSSAHLIASYMREPRLEAVLYVLSAGSLISALSNPYFVLFERDLNFKQEVLRSTAGSITGNAVGICAALIWHSYWALVAGSVASSLMSTLFSYWHAKGAPKLSLAKAMELFKFSSWLILVNILTYLNNKLDYILIGRGLGSAQLGAYHVGQQITVMSTGDFVGPLTKAMFPAFAMMSGDAERLRKSYRQAQAMLIAIAMPIGFGISAIAVDVIHVLVGEKWSSAVPVIQYLAPLVALQSTTASIEAIAMAMGKTRALFVRTFIFLLVRGSLMLIGFFVAGLMGIVYARIISGTFTFVYGLGLASSIIGGRWYDPVLTSWRSFAAVAVMWCAIIFLPSAPQDVYAISLILLSAKIAAGALIYCCIDFLLWRIAGRPVGPETRILDQFQRFIRKFVRCRESNENT